MKTYILFLTLMLFSAIAPAQTDSMQKRVAGRKNNAENFKKPYIVIISGDGFRYDYAEKFQAKNLLRLAATGVRAESMIPSFPTVTRPNHFAIMSGLYPAHSGITGNGFYDGNKKASWVDSDASFMKTEPIWVTLEKQNILTASIFWPNAVIPIQGILPTYNYERPTKGNPTPTMDQRVAAFKDWLAMPEETRPHFISFYLAATDHEGHVHGPGSPELVEAIHTIDGVVGKFDEAAKASGLPINFIFVSDHGMAAVDPKPVPFPAAAADTSKFRIFRSGGLVNVHAKNPADILPLYQSIKAIQQTDYDVYLKKDAPAEWHYGTKDDRFNRVGDILLMTKFPKVFGRKAPAGSHGFLPSEKEMHSAFYAWGPAFKPGIKISSFENVEVYGMMTKILGVKALPNDGKGKLAKQILK